MVSGKRASFCSGCLIKENFQIEFVWVFYEVLPRGIVFYEIYMRLMGLMIAKKKQEDLCPLGQSRLVGSLPLQEGNIIRVIAPHSRRTACWLFSQAFIARTRT